jgi:hypothetical protein
MARRHLDLCYNRPSASGWIFANNESNASVVTSPRIVLPVGPGVLSCASFVYGIFHVLKFAEGASIVSDGNSVATWWLVAANVELFVQ